MMQIIIGGVWFRSVMWGLDRAPRGIGYREGLLHATEGSGRGCMCFCPENF